MYVVYLAGAIQGKEDSSKIVVWRRKATEVLEDYGIKTFNPLYKYNRVKHKMMPGEIVALDLMMLRQSDIILANVSDPKHNYFGTTSEIVIGQQLGKLIVLIYGKNENVPHSWISVYATKMFKEVTDALTYIVSLSGGVFRDES